MLLKSSVTKKQRIFEIIKNKILFLELKPGQSINEVELSEELGVSRTPIREALLLLESEHLVNIYPQCGTFVSLINLDFIKEIIYMRHILETHILSEMARQKKKVDKYTERHLCLEELAIKNKNTKEYVKNDHSFHKILFGIAGHKEIWNAMENQYVQTIRFHMLDLSFIKEQEKNHEEHILIAQYIGGGELNKLNKVLEHHHDCNLKNAPICLREYGEYFIR